MKDLENKNQLQEVLAENNQCDISEVVDDMLVDLQSDINKNNTISIPIAELGLLGSGVASLIPSLRTVTQTTNFNTEGLFRIVNMKPGDKFKIAKNGDIWASFLDETGKSKFMRLNQVDSVQGVSTATMPIDPTTMMMAAALYSIEKQLGDIIEMQKEIYDFLEKEKQSEIEANVKTLVDTITEYKYNWDNELFITGHYNLILNIQNVASKNIDFYQKQFLNTISSSHFFTVQMEIKETLNKLEKIFKYYRLSLYTYSLASLLTIMLSKNFNDEYIHEVGNRIIKLSNNYRTNFRDASIYIEKMSDKSLETNILKGVGSFTKGTGEFIASIPYLKEMPVDEFFQESGQSLQDNASQIENQFVKDFSYLSNPNTANLTDQIMNLSRIYNHTSQICFDQEKIYLVE